MTESKAQAKKKKALNTKKKNPKKALSSSENKPPELSFGRVNFVPASDNDVILRRKNCEQSLLTAPLPKPRSDKFYSSNVHEYPWVEDLCLSDDSQDDVEFQRFVLAQHRKADSEEVSKIGTENSVLKQKSKKKKREFFPDYLTKSQVESGLSERRFVKGVIRNSKKRRSNAYITVEGFERDFLIIGSRDQNRALNGDTVIIEYLGEKTRDEYENCSSGSEMFNDSKKVEILPQNLAEEKILNNKVNVKQKSGSASGDIGGDDDDEDDEEVPRKIARVVQIVERRIGRVYSGFLMPVGWFPGLSAEVSNQLLRLDVGEEKLPVSATDDAMVTKQAYLTGEYFIDDENGFAEEIMNDELNSESVDQSSAANSRTNLVTGSKKTPHNIYFKPCDKRAPLILIPLQMCPKDFSKDYLKYRDKLFVVSFDRWPKTTRHPYGKFQKLVGETGNIIAETEAILETNSIRHGEFTSSVKKCLPQTPWTIPEEEIDRRLDLRKSRIFTIDPQTAKDLDDAVSCEKLPDGNLKIGVHIADVSFFVKPNSALDLEAQKRATTTYLVQRAYPMLPGVLCEDLCSLNPGVDRLAFSVVWKMTPNAEILDTWFGRTVINSCIKMSYENAQGLIDDKPWDEIVAKEISGNHTRSDVISDVKMFYKISKILRKRRFDGGALTINQPKLTFKLDDNAHPTHCSIYEIRDSNRLIEEFMLLANMSVAKKISDHFPDGSLLRCHPKPSKEALEKFVTYCQKFGLNIKGETSAELQASMAGISDDDMREIVYQLAIKPMQRAKYFCTGDYKDKRELWRHYALSTELYTHFTSPIRRYADVIVHRLLQAALDNEETPPIKPKNTTEITKNCNTKKEDAREAQDMSGRLFLCIYLKQLEKTSGFPIVEEGIIMDFGERSMDIYVPKYAFDRRVYLDDCGVVKTEVNSDRDKMTVSWPKNYKAIPPYSSTDQDRTLSTDTLKDGSLITYMSKDEEGLVESYNLLKHVQVRLVVVGRSPMDMKLYLIHPDFKVKKTPETGDGKKDHCSLEESYDDDIDLSS